MISGRRRSVIFFTVLGICLVALAVTLNVSWVVLNWRRGVLAVLGVIFFLLLIAGMVLNTIFLVREIRRNEQHDSFINAVTHELKTPITSIKLYLETLKTHEVDEAQRRQFYDVMLADSDRLLRTVEQVLRAGRTGHRRRQIQNSLIDIGQMTREEVELARSRYHLDERALRYAEAAGGDRAFRVRGDADELRAAVSNLLDNAVKYSHKEVDVSVSVEAAEGARGVAVRVRDRGVGIGRGQAKRIFNRFYRAPGRVMARVKGTGLGLFIVRSVVKKHGGQVLALSEGAGRGSTL